MPTVSPAGGVSKGVEQANAIQATNALNNQSSTTSTNNLATTGGVQSNPAAADPGTTVAKAPGISPMDLIGGKGGK